MLALSTIKNLKVQQSLEVSDFHSAPSYFFLCVWLLNLTWFRGSSHFCSQEHNIHNHNTPACVCAGAGGGFGFSWDKVGLCRCSREREHLRQSLVTPIALELQKINP